MCTVRSLCKVYTSSWTEKLVQRMCVCCCVGSVTKNKMLRLLANGPSVHFGIAKQELEQRASLHHPAATASGPPVAQACSPNTSALTGLSIVHKVITCRCSEQRILDETHDGF